MHRERWPDSISVKSDKHAYTGIKCNERTPSRENKPFSDCHSETLETVIFVSKHLHLVCGFNPVEGL